MIYLEIHIHKYKLSLYLIIKPIFGGLDKKIIIYKKNDNEDGKFRESHFGYILEI